MNQGQKGCLRSVHILFDLSPLLERIRQVEEDRSNKTFMPFLTVGDLVHDIAHLVSLLGAGESLVIVTLETCADTLLRTVFKIVKTVG